MQKLVGSPVNVDSTIIGKVTRRPFMFGRRDNFVMVTEKEDFDNGYAAVVFANDSPPKGRRSPIVCNVQNSQELKEGDIVLIEPTGEINLLYKRGTFDNVLMLTERCNCSCIMCPQPPTTEEGDKTALNMKLISLMDKDTPCLGLSGGEPTLLGNRLVYIISECKKRLPETVLTLLTNGMKFDDLDYVKSLVLVGHRNLIVDIPLYSDTDTEHNKIIRASGFYRTIKGLYNLALFNQKIGIRIVIHKLNYRRLPHLAEFIYHNFPFVFHIVFIQMETIGLAEQNIECLWIDPHDYNEQLEKAVTYLINRDMNVSIYNAQLCVLPRTLWVYARKSISSWKNIYIDECNSCDNGEQCAGFFSSSRGIHSKYVKAIKKT